MSGSGNVNYFLCPHMTLSENDIRNLCIFLPRLFVLEATRKASIPQWAQEKISGWPVLRDPELASRIGSCMEGYRNFARVHGGPGGILGFLSRALDEIDEPRFHIQEELRGKCPPDTGSAQKEIFQSALFMEIARDLDEEELAIESGYVRLNAIEQEFRDILGIEDDESDRAETNITPPLAPDTNGLLYMLPRRIEDWFRIFSLSSLLSLDSLEGMPVFVTRFPEVIDEVLEMVRTGCERDGKKFSASTHLLASIPTLDGLGDKQFRSIIEAPETSELLSSCHHDLEDFIISVSKGENAAGLQIKSRLVNDDFEKFCQKCEVPEDDKHNLSLTVVENVSLAGVPGLPALTTGFGEWPLVFLSIAARQ
ncbi:hypothetical protein SBDP1_570005 [Syntrophobacter sp. SbD1]|nr:hypothetical protein SBDP1_570005 [Syntrophobacter sp. SbD1]